MFTLSRTQQLIPNCYMWIKKVLSLLSCKLLLVSKVPRPLLLMQCFLNGKLCTIKQRRYKSVHSHTWTLKMWSRYLVFPCCKSFLYGAMKNPQGLQLCNKHRKKYLYIFVTWTSISTFFIKFLCWVFWLRFFKQMWMYPNSDSAEPYPQH